MMSAQQLRLSKKGLYMATGTSLLLAGYLFIAICFLKNYFILDATTGTGILLSPFVLTINKGHCSQRCLPVAFIFLVLLFVIPVKTVLFFELMIAILFLTESSIGKINNAFFFLLLLLSPVFNYFNNIISFPVRLWLSKIAGSILNILMKNVDVAGNIILVKGVEFSVDTACTGLKMLMTSLVIALVIIVFYQKKLKKQVSPFIIILLLFITFILNVCSNLFRIILLVLFRIMPDNAFHDVVGVLCLIIYVILPILLIFKWIIGRLSDPGSLTDIKTLSSRIFIINIILAILICYAATKVESDSAKFVHAKKYSLDGYERTILSTGVQKFENKEALIYIKPLHFYSAEHNPMICWRGSGYEFKKIDTEKLAGTEIYTGTLEKGGDKIYTAWWFEGGNCKTIAHTVWRWKSLNGEGEFVLININAATEKQLKEKAKKILATTLKEQ